MSIPKFSIIIPCFNAEKWIEECLRSALNQDYQNLEVIFVDNESTDNSLEIANRLATEFAALEESPSFMISSAKNIYPNCWDEARSRGFELMTGEYVLVMGADDFLEKSFVNKCMKIIQTRPDQILALQSPIRGVNHKQDVTGYVTHKYASLKEFKDQSLQRCPVNTPTVIYNTSLYREGLLQTKPEVYGGAADYDLYCSLADNGIMIFPAPIWLGFNYRWHPEQATWKVQKEGVNYDKMIQDHWSDQWKT